MPTYLTQVSLPAVSNFAKDAVVNTFTARSSTALTSGTVGRLTIPIAGFYNTVNGANPSLANYIGSSRSRAASACSMKVYDITDHLDGSPHGSPLFEDYMTLGAAAQASEFPTEVALCVTLRGLAWQLEPVEAPDDEDADTTPERPRQRVTGRIYLGPFHDNAGDMASGVNRPEPQLIAAALTACTRLGTDLDAEGFEWCVWSRVDAGTRAVAEAQVDNAWDTQRRRGPVSTLRTVAAV